MLKLNIKKATYFLKIPQRQRSLNTMLTIFKFQLCEFFVHFVVKELSLHKINKNV